MENIGEHHASLAMCVYIYIHIRRDSAFPGVHVGRYLVAFILRSSTSRTSPYLFLGLSYSEDLGSGSSSILSLYTCSVPNLLPKPFYLISSLRLRMLSRHRRANGPFPSAALVASVMCPARCDFHCMVGRRPQELPTSLTLPLMLVEAENHGYQ